MPFHAASIISKIKEDIRSAELPVADRTLLELELARKQGDRFSDKSSLFEYSNLLTVLGRGYAVYLGEKCDGTCSNAKIGRCIADSSMACLPKAFYTLLPGFRPQPHKGLEYGDVAAQINVGSCAYEMKGIIKKNTMNSGRTSKSVDVLLNTHLLSTSKAGEEIIRQFVEQGLVDNRVDLIAVIAPQYVDNSFKGTLRFLAKLGGKKVMFIELDDVARLIEGNSAIDV